MAEYFKDKGENSNKTRNKESQYSRSFTGSRSDFLEVHQGTSQQKNDNKKQQSNWFMKSIKKLTTKKPKQGEEVKNEEPMYV